MRGPLRALDALDDVVVGGLAGLDQRVLPGLSRRPEIIVVLIAALFLGAGAARFSLLADDTIAAEEPERVTVAPDVPEQRGGERGEASVLVGPPRGEDARAYVERRRDDLAADAEASPRATVVAIVSFDRYLIPAQADAVLAGVRALAARYRLPVDDPFDEDSVAALTRGRVATTSGIAMAVVPALREEAAAAREQADELESLVDSADDPEFAETFRRDRNRLRAAAALVGERGCACVYAVEVQAPLADLVALLEREEVRLVDHTPPGAAGSVAFSALLPEETDRVGGPEG